MMGEWPQETGHRHGFGRACPKNGKSAGLEGRFKAIKRQPELTPDEREGKQEGKYKEHGHLL